MNRKPDPEVVMVVNLVRMCQSFQTLPKPGGLFDQDAYFIYLTDVVLGADQEREKREAAKVGKK